MIRDIQFELRKITQYYVYTYDSNNDMVAMSNAMKKFTFHIPDTNNYQLWV
jgi:hypothetical protein